MGPATEGFQHLIESDRRMSWQVKRKTRRMLCHRRQGGLSRQRENLIGSNDVEKTIKIKCQECTDVIYRNMLILIRAVSRQ